MAWLLDAKDIPFALFSPESKALFPTEEAPNLGQVYFDVLGKSKQMAPKGAEGLIQILQEAQAFSLDHAVLPKAVATEMLESLPCMPTWIASIHQGNTFTILTFKNLDQLGGTWMSAGTHQRTLVFPKDSCLDLPSFTEHLGSYSEVVSPSRGFGINFNNPASTFSGADSLFISLEAQTSDSARTKCLCIWEKPGQHTIIGSIDLNSAGPDFTPFTLKVPLSDSIPPRQRINCFVMNKSERDTLFVRSARARWE